MGSIRENMLFLKQKSEPRELVEREHFQYHFFEHLKEYEWLALFIDKIGTHFFVPLWIDNNNKK